ncbi:MAG: Mov34/MPN/PAD-1 family protein [Candidatus Bathyarchaeota archaeon]|nr:Mov34/MPN/PAD-1 family protein [Candidatus Bathyarchaeota archaeon]
MERVFIKRSVIESILSYAKICHPREGILLLRGKIEKGAVFVMEVEIPPLSTRGRGFSAFPAHMLPIDFSVVGTFHSHPSGVPYPSTADLNNFYGRIMVIAVYPYTSENNIIIVNRNGEKLDYKIIDDRSGGVQNELRDL